MVTALLASHAVMAGPHTLTYSGSISGKVDIGKVQCNFRSKSTRMMEFDNYSWNYESGPVIHFTRLCINKCHCSQHLGFLPNNKAPLFFAHSVGVIKGLTIPQNANNMTIRLHNIELRNPYNPKLTITLNGVLDCTVPYEHAHPKVYPCK